MDTNVNYFEKVSCIIGGRKKVKWKKLDEIILNFFFFFNQP